ncbi:MAG: hypothetical protein SNJ29_10790 [Rikenellaceae bacterium]
MTRVCYTPPPTKLMLWYSDQSDKSGALRAIIVKAGVSNTLANNWVRGLGEPKKEEHIKALEQITGYNRTELFKFVE